MTNSLEYTTVDRVFSMLSRDIRNTKIDEEDIIEWLGLALGFMKIPQAQEERVQILKVKNYHSELPSYLQNILQIAKYNEAINTFSPPKEENNTIKENTCIDCEDIFNLGTVEDEIYFGTLEYNYHAWHTSNYKNKFTPVRLSNHIFFKNIVCKEKDYDSIYQLGGSCPMEEYTIVGTENKRLRFSFENGLIAISYLRTPIDDETGYPLIPDETNCLHALEYFIKWKIAERNAWEGREGWLNKADRAEKLWLKYLKQFNNFMKLPKTVDELQNLLEQSYYLIPNHKKYYGYFGSLGKSEIRNFNLTNYR